MLVDLKLIILLD